MSKPEPGNGLRHAPRWQLAANVFFLLLCLLSVAAIFYSHFSQPMVASPITKCRKNLKRIGLAMHMYHGRYGVFPPPYLTNENGEPAHSWRVLLLPLLEQQALYDEYRFDEPWDGPNNARLHERMPEVFRCYRSTDDPMRHANYVAVVGDGHVFDPGRMNSIADIKDGASNTLMVVETSGHNVAWLAPYDGAFDETTLTINDPNGSLMGSEHGGGAHGLFADGSVQWVSETSGTDDLHLLFLIANGSEVTIDPEISTTIPTGEPLENDARSTGDSNGN